MCCVNVYQGMVDIAIVISVFITTKNVILVLKLIQWLF